VLDIDLLLLQAGGETLGLSQCLLCLNFSGSIISPLPPHPPRDKS
jgi:hypothetical protein